MAINFNGQVEAVKLSIVSDIPTLIAGATGIGKSAAVAEACKSELNGYQYQVRMMLTAGMDETDLVGIPVQVDGVTKHARPDFIVDPEASYKEEPPVVYFLDEISRAPHQVRHALMQALYPTSDGFRYLGDHRLRKMDRLVCAYNPADAGYDTDDLDPALVARCSHMKAIANQSDWQKWALKQNMDADLVEFMMSGQPMEVSCDAEITQRKNPRTATAAIKAWQAHSDNPGLASEHVALEFICGLIGPEGKTLVAFLNDRDVKPVSAEALYNMSKKERNSYLNKLRKDNRHDIQTQVATSVENWIGAKYGEMKKAELEAENQKELEEIFVKTAQFLMNVPKDLAAKVIQAWQNSIFGTRLLSWSMTYQPKKSDKIAYDQLADLYVYTGTE
jgi:hypothetical protein